MQHKKKLILSLVSLVALTGSVKGADDASKGRKTPSYGSEASGSQSPGKLAASFAVSTVGDECRISTATTPPIRLRCGSTLASTASPSTLGRNAVEIWLRDTDQESSTATFSQAQIIHALESLSPPDDFFGLNALIFDIKTAAIQIFLKIAESFSETRLNFIPALALPKFFKNFIYGPWHDDYGCIFHFDRLGRIGYSQDERSSLAQARRFSLSEKLTLLSTGYAWLEKTKQCHSITPETRKKLIDFIAKLRNDFNKSLLSNYCN